MRSSGQAGPPDSGQGFFGRFNPFNSKKPPRDGKDAQVRCLTCKPCRPLLRLFCRQLAYAVHARSESPTPVVRRAASTVRLASVPPPIPSEGVDRSLARSAFGPSRVFKQGCSPRAYQARELPRFRSASSARRHARNCSLCVWLTPVCGIRTRCVHAWQASDLCKQLHAPLTRTLGGCARKLLQQSY